MTPNPSHQAIMKYYDRKRLKARDSLERKYRRYRLCLACFLVVCITSISLVLHKILPQFDLNLDF